MDVIKTTVILREIHVPEGKALKNIVTEEYYTGTIDLDKGYWTYYLGKEEDENNYIFVDEKDVPAPPEPPEEEGEEVEENIEE